MNMNLRFSGLLPIAAFVVVCLLGSAQSLAQNAYITNQTSNDVSVIDTARNTVTATIPVGAAPSGVAVTPDGSKVYVTSDNVVSVIGTVTSTVIATIPFPGSGIPRGVAVTPDGNRVYVANLGENTVSVINTATNAVIGSPIPVGVEPSGVAVTPDGSKVYVANALDNTVSVINTATNAVIGSPIAVGHPVACAPRGLAVTPDGSKVYVANGNGLAPADSVSVINTATDTVIGSPIPVGLNPVAFGLFIQPTAAIKFAGTPGKSNCYGKSVSALVRQYVGLNAAAAALGYPSIRALQDAILEYCETEHEKRGHHERGRR